MDHLQSFPVLLKHTQKAGRTVISSKPIEQGETVLSFYPYACVVCDEYTSSVCTHCLKLLDPEQAVACPGCKLICSCDGHEDTEMIAATTHSQLECLILQKLSKRKHLVTSDEWDEIRLVLHILCLLVDEVRQEKLLQQQRQQQQQQDVEVTTEDSAEKENGKTPVSHSSSFRNDTAPNFTDLWRLTSNMEHMKANPEVLKRLQIMNDVIESTLQEAHPTIFVEAGLVKDEPVLELLCRVKVNSFGLWNQTKDKSYALAVYPRLSFINHSCMPSCYTKREGLKLSVNTLRDVTSHSELTISYINVKDDKQTRQQKLRELFFFDCECARCATNDSDHTWKLIEPYLCVNDKCPGYVVPAEIPDGEITRTCNVCGTPRESFGQKRKSSQ